MDEVIWLVIGAPIGGLAAWLYLHARIRELENQLAARTSDASAASETSPEPAGASRAPTEEEISPPPSSEAPASGADVEP